MAKSSVLANHPMSEEQLKAFLEKVKGDSWVAAKRSTKYHQESNKLDLTFYRNEQVKVVHLIHIPVIGCVWQPFCCFSFFGSSHFRPKLVGAIKGATVLQRFLIAS